MKPLRIFLLAALILVVFGVDNAKADNGEITRGLNLTVIDTAKEIYPDYGGTSTQNSVVFKVRLENTGSEADTFIPEIISTLDDDWAVTFWQDSSKTQAWSTTSGLSIESDDIDFLWVHVSVDDGSDEGNYTVQFSVYDEDEYPDARKDGDVTVTIIRPELMVQQSNIFLEIEGSIGNASQVQDGDTVVVLVDVENTGTVDADNVRVEIFYYPKKSPETQNEIDSLMIAGFEFDEGENTWIYSLYDKTTNIKSSNKKTIASDDWVIKGGEWYVEVRVDYDEDDDNGEILEPNENDNDARYSELLRIKPDLVIYAMRVDTKYAGTSAQTPNIDDIVTFTVTVSNTGAADVNDARLYITADTYIENVRLKDRTTREYVEFDVDIGETTDVHFRWKAENDDWTAFRAEVNPVCDDVVIDSWTCENEGDGFSEATGRMFDEGGNYNNNEYPRSGVFEQNGAEVRFQVLPDFIIKKVTMDPRNPKVGEIVEITVTIENIGNSDWQISSKQLTIVFEDGTGTELTSSVGESINQGDTTEVKFSWTVPDEGNKNELDLTYTIDTGSGSFEINQCNTCDDWTGSGTDNDVFVDIITIYPSDDSGISVPSVSLSLISSIAAIGIIAMRRRS
jgi:hypothetical protein